MLAIILIVLGALFFLVSVFAFVTVDPDHKAWNTVLVAAPFYICCAVGCVALATVLLLLSSIHTEVHYQVRLLDKRHMDHQSSLILLQEIQVDGRTAVDLLRRQVQLLEERGDRE